MPLGCECDCQTVTIGIPGPRGPAGAPGGGTGVFNEVPAGVQDGVNLVFTLAFTPFPGSTQVHRNGLREELGVSYTESGATLTFTTAPLSTDVLTVDYVII